MTPDQWERIKRVLDVVLDGEPTSPPNEQIRELCAGDAGLETEVLSLLARRDVTFLGCT